MISVLQSKAQLNNSWIDYSKTYYKFRIAKDTLCRISQQELAALGLSGVNADYFQLWRNGQQVRLFTSVTNAVLGTADYIEFWGEMNDGRPDNQLYQNSEYQLNQRYSLETDTVSYFLTVNTASNNLRYVNTVNTPPGSMLAESYFMRKTDIYYRRWLNRGFAKIVGEYIYSSAYDQGEGYTTNDFSPCCNLNQAFGSLNVYSAGPSSGVSVRTVAFGNAGNSRNLRLKVGTTTVYDSAMFGFTSQSVNVNNLPLSYLLSSNSITLVVSDSSLVSTDRIVVASIGITYPARFIFNNQKVFDFELSAAPSGNYLLIESFNFGTLAPILYDVTEGRRYTGDIVSTPGKIKFVLPPSTISSRKFILLSQDATAVNQISNISTKIFTDYSLASNQADYIIISNPFLFNDGNGVNYVDQYRAYRSSMEGGRFNAKIFDIEQLTDQFAFGIKNHPGSIRDFIRFAAASFSSSPKFVTIIGRGVDYRDARNNESNRLAQRLNLVTTFGWPASDVLLVSQPGTQLPIVPIGRIPAINTDELKAYLKKVIQYEQAQKSSSPFIIDKAWMKNFIHVVGGKDTVESETFRQYMEVYEHIADQTMMGANVNTFTKTSTAVIQQANSQRIEDLFNEGLAFIGYFGHSSANTFEFNLSNPSVYNNIGKYPFFNVSGCNAGNYFVFDSLRLTGNLCLSEKYVLADQKGSIGFIADSHFGIPLFLDYYNTALYNNFSHLMYGQSIGDQMRKVNETLGGGNPNIDFYTRIHLEELNLDGDPAIKLNTSQKPDFVIEDQLVKISPNIISVADNQFNLNVSFMNIGKAIDDSLLVTVKRKLPNDSIRVLFNGRIPGLRYIDSILLQVSINPLTDKGLNQIIVNIDPLNSIDELYESNNSITKDFYIFEDELRPAYPYEYSIINHQNLTFTASTANPLSGLRQYTMEIDTTELFNSPLKKTYNQSGLGGIVEFRPSNLIFADSTVYYWRVAMVPLGTANYIWNQSSFIYLAGSSSGFNQSHYYQHLKSVYNNIQLDSDRKFKFKTLQRNLTIRTGLYPYYNYDKINVNLDFDQLEFYGCGYSNIQFYVFDTSSLTPWRNRNVSTTNGLYGSKYVCPNSATPYDSTRAFFEFPYNDAVSRKSAMDFIDSIPDGMYVAITNLGRQFVNTSFINQWKSDTLVLGSGNSLYHKLKSIGFTQIDSFYKNLPFLYFFKKGNSGFASTQIMGPKDSTYIDKTFNLTTTFTDGSISSPAFGPARRWESLHWRSTTSDPLPPGDISAVDIIGVNNSGAEDYLRTINPSIDTSLNFVDASLYPRLKLRLLNSDKKYVTPQQLSYFRLNADYIPEGAVAPNLLFQMPDSVDQGQPLDFSLAFKNISETAFDTLMKFRFVVTDRNNDPRNYDIPKGKVLLAGDTLIIHYAINTNDLEGMNTLFVEVNPDGDQQEMYHYNNVLFKEFFVRPDNYNPLLDVTFDGVHILNTDIVSSRPKILIELKDESHYLALADTSLLKVQVRFPNESNLRQYYFGGDTMRFIPADISSGDNTASIEFNPTFFEDGEYELIVSGKDVMGNTAGDLSYRVTFNVINKPMISNLLNYPNPFTTSTAFVFTVTGQEIPQNIRIQILTISGKIVREITTQELGPIHIGNNITEFKWDGTDMYGQKLANGVYLYRVLTNLNGHRLDKYDGRNANGDVISSGINNTDRYFNKGYGKMYLMR